MERLRVTGFWGMQSLQERAHVHLLASGALCVSHEDQYKKTTIMAHSYAHTERQVSDMQLVLDSLCGVGLAEDVREHIHPFIFPKL